MVSTFVGGSDGVIRALDGATGEVIWKAYTGGAILFPPAIADDRLFVGSSDGWVYAMGGRERESCCGGFGLLLPRGRSVPTGVLLLRGRWLPGVLVEDGVVYAAAGIASYDGTHVIALDAATGKIRWQNNRSGRMFGEDRVTGVSVQGHLLLHEDRLYMAGGKCRFAGRLRHRGRSLS